ncbi:MAG: TraR/DksA family transcriptional regulator [bacterium]|nr:TraR/DksA family transcriptional regulator [bacterium]
MLEEHARYKLQVLIPEIDAAFGRVRDGTYGVCASCEEPIPRARLERRPEAARCVECQEEADRVRTAHAAVS